MDRLNSERGVRDTERKNPQTNKEKERQLNKGSDTKADVKERGNKSNDGDE